MDLGWQELAIILVIIMIFFGAGKLPEIAKSLGQGVKEFRAEAEGSAAPGISRDTVRTTASDASGASPRTLAPEEAQPRPAFVARDAAEI
jgi:sec-independent protein translocase protein TatA